LVESAFYKLSDYFQSVESPGELYESQLSFIFAVAIFQEFQARGFSHLLPYIQVNRPYPRKQQRKADIFVKIPKSKLPPEILQRWSASGVCEENWVEVKFFGGAERRGKLGSKPRNLGEVLEDLLRLKFYVSGEGKYLLLVFNRKPQYYLPKRNYLNCLLKPGRDLVKIDFSKEPKTVINSICDENLRNRVNGKTIEFDLQKFSIEPMVVKGLLTSPAFEPLKRSMKSGIAVSEPEYFFYLLRILEFY